MRRNAPFFLIALLVLTIFSPVAFAQPGQEPGPNLDEPFGTHDNISTLVANIFSFGIYIIIIAAAIFIAIGAYFYFIAAGNAEMAKTGKDYIQRSVIGLILGLLAFIILQTISPQFVRDLGGGVGGAGPGGGNPRPPGGAANNPPGGNPQPPVAQRPPQPAGPAENLQTIVDGGLSSIRVLTEEERRLLEARPDQYFTMRDRPNTPLSHEEVLTRIRTLEQANPGIELRGQLIEDPRFPDSGRMIPSTRFPYIEYPLDPNRLGYNGFVLPAQLPQQTREAADFMTDSLRSSGFYPDSRYSITPFDRRTLRDYVLSPPERR